MAWLCEGNDPQFVMEGPFDRGEWRLRFVAIAFEQSRYARMQLFLAKNGEFTEELSIRFGQMASREAEHCLSFYLPFRARALRFDPMDSPGIFRMGPVVGVRRPLIAGMLRRVISISARSPSHSFDLVSRALRMVARRDHHAWNRALVRLARVEQDNEHHQWMRGHVVARKGMYPAEAEDGLLSLVTTVYDTPPALLSEAVRSVLEQGYDRFEWVILDNGSRDIGSRAILRRAARDPRVRLHRVETNLGIIRGMRFVLERATGRYILPLDSDDYLYPDCLSIMAHHIQRYGYPALLYSDEDKVRGSEHVEAFFKPAWDPVLLRNCCYIAHLCAIKRELALELGGYTDPGAEGCHDWDTFLRFLRAGYIARHVPEIVYSWRMHAHSTAASIGSKGYVFDSHRHVLSMHLSALSLSAHFSVELSPLFPGTPDWWIRRRRVAARRLHVCVFIRDATSSEANVRRIVRTVSGYPLERLWLVASDSRTDPMMLTRAADALRTGTERVTVEVAEGAGIMALGNLARSCLEEAAGPALMALLSDAITPEGDEWPWEALGLIEAYPDAVVVGGRILDRHRRVISAGECLGFGGFCGSPDAGRAAQDPGYFGLALKQRSASAVAAAFCVVDAGFLAHVAPRLAAFISDLSFLGPCLGAQAIEQDARVIYSPFIVATTSEILWPGNSGDGREQAFLSLYGHIEPDRRFYHPLLSLDPRRAFAPVGNEILGPNGVLQRERE